MTYESAKAHFLNYCKHFPKHGTMNVVCLAGITLKEVNPGGNFPCIVSNGCTDRCSKFEPRLEVEADEYARQREASLQQFAERLSANKCPHCGVEVKRKVQVGICVYAEPCNHRLYQGEA